MYYHIIQSGIDGDYAVCTTKTKDSIRSKRILSDVQDKDAVIILCGFLEKKGYQFGYFSTKGMTTTVKEEFFRN